MPGWMHVCSVDATLLVPYIIETLMSAGPTDTGGKMFKNKRMHSLACVVLLFEIWTYQAVPHQSCPQVMSVP